MLSTSGYSPNQTPLDLTGCLRLERTLVLQYVASSGLTEVR